MRLIINVSVSAPDGVAAKISPENYFARYYPVEKLFLHTIRSVSVMAAVFVCGRTRILDRSVWNITCVTIVLGTKH